MPIDPAVFPLDDPCFTTINMVRGLHATTEHNAHVSEVRTDAKPGSNIKGSSVAVF